MIIWSFERDLFIDKPMDQLRPLNAFSAEVARIFDPVPNIEDRSA